MSVEAKRWQVGVVGVTPGVIFLCERMSLVPAVRLAGAFDADPAHRKLIAAPGCLDWEQIERAILSPEVDVLILGTARDEQVVSAALTQGKHVILDGPGELSSEALRRLSVVAKTNKCVAAVFSPGRWSSSFLTTATAKLRCGQLRMIRSLCFERAAPGEIDEQGLLRAFGYDRFDQLLHLAGSTPICAFARQNVDPQTGVDHGLFAVIDFANGCIAQIEMQSRSRLSLRTGWMLEGAESSFRNNRLYTMTTDGEIVDEPWTIVSATSDGFIEALLEAWQGTPAQLPTLEDVASVVELIEMIDRAATLPE